MKARKILSLILAVAMIFGTIGTVAFAEEVTTFEVSTAEDLINAVAADKTDVVININDSFTIDVWPYVSDSRNVTINGNNNVLTVKEVETKVNGWCMFAKATDFKAYDLTVLFESGTDSVDGDGFVEMYSGVLSNVTIGGGYAQVVISDNSAIENASVEITDCKFFSSAKHGIYTDDDGNAGNIVITNTDFDDIPIAIQLRSNEQIIGSTFTNARHSVGATSEATVTECTYDSSSTIDAWGGSVTFVNNFLDNTIRIENWAPVHFTFDGNTFGGFASVEGDYAGSTVTVLSSNIYEDGVSFDSVINTGENVSAVKLYVGEGTQDSPFLIYTLDELVALANNVNAGKYKGNYIYVDLMATIDVDQCNDENLFPNYAWIPIGTSSNAFQGSFNGNGNTISNLWIANGGGYDGFFGQLGNNPEKPAVVKDLVIEDASAIFNGNRCGVLAGEAHTAVISNVTVDAEAIASSVTYIGGFIGHGYATFNNCSFTGILDSDAVQVGGLLGSGQCRAYDCYVNADISGSIWVGGICGNGQESYAFEGNYVTGTVHADSDYYGASAAGIVTAPSFGDYSSSNISIKNNYCDAILTCGTEPVNAPIIGGFNSDYPLQDYTELLQSSVTGNSWNRDKIDIEEIVAYGLGETENAFVDERNNALVATASDLNYLFGIAKEDIVLFQPYASENGIDEKDIEQVYGVSEIIVEFEDVTEATAEGEKVYNINLKGKDGVKINRLNSADLEFVLTQDNGSNEYEIIASNDEVTINNVKGDRYEFHYADKDADVDTDTADSITIGQVKFTGYGQFDFAVKANETNTVHATTFYNNIVDTFIPGGSATDNTKGILTIDDDTITDVVIEVPTRNLTVEIDFNNAVNKQVADYQDMTVIISGGDLPEAIEIELGNETYTEDVEIFGKSEASYTVDVTADNKYVVTVDKALSVNRTYTVTVKGAGYRTVRKNVTMNEDKTVENKLSYWNNVKDVEGADYLAGDIVKDNTINVYDLSAVVSYFGTNPDVAAESTYAKYDLNRDGKIDSKDVAYVLVSWGK